MTPEERTEAMAKADVVRLDGVRAQQQLEMLKGLVEDEQKAILAELMAKTRSAGEVYDAGVWQLVALERLVQNMVDRIHTGKRAAKKMKSYSELGDSDNG